MLEGLSEGMMLLVVSGIGAIGWYGIQRMIAGQDKTNETLLSIHRDIEKTNERVTRMEIQFSEHVKYDGDQHKIFMETMGRMVATMVAIGQDKS